MFLSGFKIIPRFDCDFLKTSLLDFPEWEYHQLLVSYPTTEIDQVPYREENGECRHLACRNLDESDRCVINT